MTCDETHDLVLPPLDEQSRDRCASSTRDSASSTPSPPKPQRAIDLLQERRTALISAAVTGKIDVRGLAETEAA